MAWFRLENRTGKVVSLGRLTLALFMLVALGIGVEEGRTFSDIALDIGLIYLVLSILLLVATWSNWWLEHRLRLPSHLLDLAFFLGITLASGFNVANPFFLFFVFLVLSAATRWGFPGAFWTAIAATLMFAAQALLPQAEPALSSTDYAGAIVRAGHLLVLSMMIGWFGVTQIAGRRESDRGFPDKKSAEPPVREAIGHMAQCLQAGSVSMIWSDPEEPWIHIATQDEGEFRADKAPPSEFSWIVSDQLAGRTFLFDVRHRRALFARGRRLRTLAGVDPVNPALAERLGTRTGIVAPIGAESFEGYFFAGGIDGLSWNDLAVARRATTEIARALNRSAALRATEESAEDRTRLGLARDLHDSVSQILAGIGLKLRAARTSAPDAEHLDAELVEIEKDLVRYQHYIHAFIDDLRNPSGDAGRVALDAKLADVAGSLRRQWGVEIDFVGEELRAVPKSLALDVACLIREAVANAVRHGGATRIALAVETDESRLVIRCQDDGRGFPELGCFTHEQLSEEDFGPQSIRERADLLGGTVGLVSTDEGAILTIHLPLGGAER